MLSQRVCSHIKSTTTTKRSKTKTERYDGDDHHRTATSANSSFSNYWYVHSGYKSNIVVQRPPRVLSHLYIPRYPNALIHTCCTMAKDDKHGVCMKVLRD